MDLWNFHIVNKVADLTSAINRHDFFRYLANDSAWYRFFTRLRRFLAFVRKSDFAIQTLAIAVATAMWLATVAYRRRARQNWRSISGQRGRGRGKRWRCSPSRHCRCNSVAWLSDNYWALLGNNILLCLDVRTNEHHTSSQRKRGTEKPHH